VSLVTNLAAVMIGTGYSRVMYRGGRPAAGLWANLLAELLTPRERARRVAGRKAVTGANT